MATATSGSLTVLAAALDSALDILSGTIIFVTHRFIKKRDDFRYPVGKARYENLGIIVFASVMGAASLQIAIQSVEKLIQGPDEMDLTWLTMGVLAAAVISKFLLWLWCRSMAVHSASCGALAQDHLNDVMTNSLTAVLVVIGAF